MQLKLNKMLDKYIKKKYRRRQIFKIGIKSTHYPKILGLNGLGDIKSKKGAVFYMIDITADLHKIIIK